MAATSLSHSSPLTHPIHWTHICSIEAYGNTANSRHSDSHWWSNILLIRDGKDGPSKGHITWLVIEISDASIHGGDGNWD